MSKEGKLLDFDAKKRKKDEAEEASATKAMEGTAEYLESVAKANEEARVRVKKKRSEDNERVKREYRLDKDKKK